MKKLKLIFGILLIAVFFVSCRPVDPQCIKTCNNGGIVNSNCGCDCPNGYSGENCQIPPLADCAKYHTGKIAFKNSSSNRTYDIVLDGSYIYRGLQHGKQTPEYTVNKGIHAVKFYIAGTNILVCSSSPNIVECSLILQSCSN